MFRKDHARLRLAFVDGVATEDLKYAQSASGHSASQRTFPLDSLSISMAKDSAHDLDPYATFRRCPVVVLHRDANSSRSETDMPFQKSISSMRHYHHAVIENATPNVEFTKWCPSPDNECMGNQMAGIRRHNLAALIRRDFRGNKSEIARAYNPQNPKPQYFSDLLRENSGKAFGEKAARSIEEKAGLQPGQLDLPNSHLLLDDSRRNKLKDELRLAVEDLVDKDDQREAILAIRKIQAKRTARRKAG